jgi:uncharacterized protein
MSASSLLLGLLLAGLRPVWAQCPDYADYSTQKHDPLSAGKYQLSYQRPDPACRTFYLAEVEQVISDMNATVQDPDLYRLFQNTYPNTLDTTVSWKGIANGSTDEEARTF